MKKALLLGIIASFFFAFTFILNRSMHLGGGFWVWSASLRYLFTLPMIALVVWRKEGFGNIHASIKKAPLTWLLWSTVGFGLFYAPLSFAGDYGQSWLIAASWQMTIVMGILLTPIFGKKIPLKNLAISCLILVGVALLQLGHIHTLQLDKIALTLVPIAVAAVAYPLGNRKLMAFCDESITTTQRIYGMTLCSMPFWLILSVFGGAHAGLPDLNQTFQAFCVALLSGLLATLFFFRATDLVKHNQKQLAVIESTQAGEVLFTLLGGILFLGDSLPSAEGFLGIALIVFGMLINSLLAAYSPSKKTNTAVCMQKQQTSKSE